MTVVAEHAPPLPPGWIRPPTEDELPYDDGEPAESELHYEQITS